MNEALNLIDHPLLPYLFAVGVSMITVLWNGRRQARRFRQAFTRQSEQMQGLNAELYALLSSAEGMGEKLEQLEQRVRLLEQRQDQMTLKEPSEQVYSHALRMVRLGEDINTVVERSGISRGEAELLQRLNGMNQRKNKGSKTAA